MLAEMEAVQKFHEKHGFLPRDKTKGTWNGCQLLRSIGEQLVEKSDRYKKIANEEESNGDSRLYRAQLMIEELGEYLIALSKDDEVEMLDGISDLLFVVIGSALVEKLPLHHGFWEVYRSNMTKKVRSPDDPRMRNKGSEYSPPDLERILRDVRND